MVGGQVLDMEGETRQCTQQEIIDIHTRKTGALIQAGCVLGVLAGGGSEEQISAAINFADNIGLAFQIRDDMLDVIGNSQELGKATGSDEQKNTFVQLYGLDACDTLVQKYTADAIASLSAFPENAYIIELANYLTNRRV